MNTQALIFGFAEYFVEIILQYYGIFLQLLILASFLHELYNFPPKGRLLFKIGKVFNKSILDLNINEHNMF